MKQYKILLLFRINPNRFLNKRKESQRKDKSQDGQKLHNRDNSNSKNRWMTY
jgi:hypothetical protein